MSLVAACGLAAASAVTVGAADWLLRRAIRSTPWGTCETGGHPIDADHHIDLTVYEAHLAPHVSVGSRDGLAWIESRWSDN